jgi:RluA family pseudouridine synthase
MTPIPPLDILYQDDDLIVVNKPAGLPSESSVAVADSVLARVSAMTGRTAILHHRLDRLTSGCILLGRTARHNRAIALLFEHKQVRKEYAALVEGLWPKGMNRVETLLAPLGGGRWENRKDAGKPAVTTFRVMGTANGRTLLQALPKTGRTHQIRLHCLHAGCPVVGDFVYGDPNQLDPLMLHARKMAFRHPADGRTIEVEAPFPDYWQAWLNPLPKPER